MTTRILIWILILAAAGAAAWAGIALWRQPAPGSGPGAAPGTEAPLYAPASPTVPATPGPAAPASPPTPAPRAAPATPVVPEPAVPEVIPTPPPGLDQELARDYKEALARQGIPITSLEITDTRATGGARRAEIAYRTAAGQSMAALRPEIVRILGPGANPRLALDQITVLAVGPQGKVVASVTVSVPDLDRWLRAQIGDGEFYSRWTVRGPAR